MMHRPLGSAAVVGALLVTGCFHPTYDHPLCGPEGECPSDLVCSQVNVCQEPSSADGGVDAVVRLISPLSMSTVTQQRPTLRWLLSAGAGTPVVELCRDRECTTPIAVESVVGADMLHAAPAASLPPGWVFWRVRIKVGGGQIVRSPTWQFWVGRASAGGGVDTSGGVVLDVNGDGYADFLIGTGYGMVYLYLGSAAPAVGAWNGTTAAARIDVPMPERHAADFAITAVTSVGDVNGDGYADFAVGVFEANFDPPPPVAVPTAHVYLGSATPSAADWSGASAAARIDLVSPAGMGSFFGRSVAGVGDVNRDGYGDFLVGDGVYGSSRAYLYLGAAAPTASAWNGASTPARIDLVEPDDGTTTFGGDVGGAGDVNGDGYADFVVGGHKGFPPGGAAHVYLGGAAPSASEWNATPSTARIDLTNPLSTISNFGSSVAGAGDINGDGYADFLVGVDEADPASPAAYIYLGSASPGAALWNGSSPAARIGVLNPGATDEFDASVAGAGDVNGDGVADFLVGTLNLGAGTTHLYLGASAPSAAQWNGTSPVGRIDLANPQATNGNNVFGDVVAGAGDVDADGYTDFLVAATHDTAPLTVVQFYRGAQLPSGTLWNGASAARRLQLINPDDVGSEFGESMSGAR